MKIFHNLLKRDYSWEIFKNKIDDSLIIEITDHGIKNRNDVYNKILGLLIDDCSLLSISIKIDKFQSKLDLNGLRHKPIISDQTNKYFIGKDYDNNIMPVEEDRFYVINLIGEPHELLMYKFPYITGVPLSAILIGMDNNYSKNLEYKIAQTNKLIYQWFNLNLSMNNIFQLLNKCKFIICSIDGHLMYITNSKNNYQKATRYIELIGQNEKLPIKYLYKDNKIKILLESSSKCNT